MLILMGKKKRLRSPKACPPNIQELFASGKELKGCSELIASIVPRIAYVNVPGFVLVKRKNKSAARRYRVDSVYKVLTDATLIRGRAVLLWALELHEQGKSLNGKFKYSDLRLTSRGLVKCRSSKVQALKNANAVRRSADMVSVKQVILDMVGVDKVTELPIDLQLLLEVLSHYKQGNELLVQKHPGLKKESKKLHLFTQMFAHLEVLQKTNRSKYQKIIGNLPFGNKEWIERIKSNSFLTRIYHYLGRMASYGNGPEGVVLLYRNSIAHLIKGHSIRMKMIRKKGQSSRWKAISLFKFNQMAHILGGTLPGVIGKLMKALNDEDELEDALS